MVTVICDDVAWFRVGHESAVGAVRRGAVALAERLGFDETRAGEVGIIATELAGNQVRHAGGGTVLVRACRADGQAGVELLASDSGPGMADVGRAFGDGHSTAGTLGIGLGAVRRLASHLHVFSAPGRGTVIAASVGPDGHIRTPAPPASAPAAPRGAEGGGVEAAAITRPMTGEEVCGDAYAVRVDDGALSAVLLDGLGHGPLAASAASAGVRAFREAPPGSALSLLTAVHRRLAGTRGAAVAVIQHDGGDTLRHAGIGNIAGQVIGGDRRQGLMSYPGIAGAQARALRETVHELPERAVVVLHTDGVSERLRLGGDLEGLPPILLAAVCLRDFGVRNDDAGVLVLTRRPR